MSHRILFAVVAIPLAFASSGCALLKAAASGDPKAAAKAAEDQVRWMKESAEAAGKDCEPLKAANVSWGEERAIGSVIAISLTQKNKASYFLDGMTETEPAALQKKVAGGEKITLAPSDKNTVGAYVAVVGRNLAGWSARPDIAWSFGVLETAEVNAFSAPGGYVVVTTGLLAQIENEAQLASVLGHEIGHVTNRHTINVYMGVKHALCIVAMTGKHYKDRNAADMPAAIAEGLKFVDPIALALKNGGKFDIDEGEPGFISKVSDMFIEAYNLFSSRPNELEADKTSLELLYAAGYDNSQFDAILTRVAAKGGFFVFGHPPAKDRIEALNTLRAPEGELGMFTNGKVKGENPPALKLLPKPAS